MYTCNICIFCVTVCSFLLILNFLLIRFLRKSNCSQLQERDCVLHCHHSMCKTVDTLLKMMSLSRQISLNKSNGANRGNLFRLQLSRWATSAPWPVSAANKLSTSSTWESSLAPSKPRSSIHSREELFSPSPDRWCSSPMPPACATEDTWSSATEWNTPASSSRKISIHLFYSIQQSRWFNIYAATLSN